jgi:tetratricopeptide (TPR) repeat protein
LDGLGTIENDQGRLDEALKYHQQALELRTNYDIFHTNNSLIALSHIYIAYDYKDIGDYDIARAHVKKARTLIRKLNLQEDQAKEAACHIIEGSILYDTENDKEALEEFQRALEINKQQGMPDDHPNLASIYQSMSLCYLNPDSIINRPDSALDYCAKALKIRLKALPHNHPSTGITYRSIGLAYEQSKQYQDALEFYQKANIIHKALNGTINKLKETDNDIKRIQK